MAAQDQDPFPLASLPRHVNKQTNPTTLQSSIHSQSPIHLQSQCNSCTRLPENIEQDRRTLLQKWSYSYVRANPITPKTPNTSNHAFMTDNPTKAIQTLIHQPSSCTTQPSNSVVKSRDKPTPMTHNPYNPFAIWNPFEIPVQSVHMTAREYRTRTGT